MVWGGVGEPTICVVALSIMNAISAARGKPVRSLPLKHEGLRIVGRRASGTTAASPANSVQARRR